MLLIMGKSVATATQMKEYLQKHGAPAKAQELPAIYLEEGEKEGVRGDIAFCQSILETGFFRFEGSAVTYDQYNFAGLGVTKNGMKGNSFKNVREGIRAQIQHLKAYACDIPLNGKLVDQRFNYVKRGTAQYVEWLGIQENPIKAGWAAGKNYGAKIINILEEVKKGDEKMKIFVCVGHSKYKNGAISSADGTAKGGVNEYKYNKELAPIIADKLKKAGHEAVLCIAPEGKCNSLQDEINYFIGEEAKKNYDISIQLHLNASGSGAAQGTEAYAYSAKGKEIAARICNKLGTVWKNRGAQINQGLYWTRKTKSTAVLIESFFCDNSADYKKAVSLGMEKHAELIVEGIIGKDITDQEVPEFTDGTTNIESDVIKYRVQCGAFKTKSKAEEMKKKLEEAGFPAIIKEEK